MLNTNSRRQLFVDADVQGAILRRIFVYWCVCFLFITLPIWLYESLTHPDEMFYEHLVPMGQRYWPVYLCLLALLPFLVWEALRLTNRFCGPMRRVIAELQLRRETGKFRPLQFRDHDFWKTLADSLAEFANQHPHAVEEQHADLSA